MIISFTALNTTVIFSVSVAQVVCGYIGFEGLVFKERNFSWTNSQAAEKLGPPIWIIWLFSFLVVLPLYSGKHTLRSTLDIFCLNKSLLFRKRITAVLASHGLLQISLNNFRDLQNKKRAYFETCLKHSIGWVIFVEFQIIFTKSYHKEHCCNVLEAVHPFLTFTSLAADIHHPEIFRKLGITIHNLKCVLPTLNSISDTPVVFVRDMRTSLTVGTYLGSIILSKLSKKLFEMR